ncbi:MAG: amidohydrolase family protein [Muribaculaceae bacterium]|nr:amidohydrolase family protein [Muribaculaceae bacterium]
MKIYKANIVYTQHPGSFDVLKGGCVAVEDGRVVGVASDASHFAVPDAEVVDYGDCLLIPAMNDMHVHASQYRNQGIAMDLELLPWLANYTFPEEAKFASLSYADSVYRRFVRDLWRFGTMRCVTFATTHYEGSRRLMQLFQEAGMGALVGKVSMDRNSRPELCESVADSVRHIEALAEEFGDPEGLVRPIVTPRFIPSCTPEMLRACGELARKYNLSVQSHLSENTDEIAFVRKLEPESRNYADAYLRYGLFGQQPTVMAHCVWPEEEELQLLKENGVMVAHCPTSNLNVSSGMAPVRTFLDKGIRVGLGSDISGGHDLSIFRMMAYAVQVSKMYGKYCGGAPFLTLPEVFWIATKSAGSFFGKVGSFEPGYEFDALVIDDSALNYDNYTIVQRIERFIYLGDDRYITHRYCRGVEIPEPKV